MDPQQMASPPQTQSQTRAERMLQLAVESQNQVEIGHEGGLQLRTSAQPGDGESSDHVPTEFDDNMDADTTVHAGGREASTHIEANTGLETAIQPSRPTLKFSERVRRLQGDDLFDVAIVCQGREFKTTLDIVALHSPRLRVSMQPVTEHQVLDWNQEQLYVVERFADYLYNFDYGSRDEYRNPAANERPGDLEIAVGMFNLADKYQITFLERKSKARFEREVTDIVRKASVVELLDIVPLLYKNTAQRASIRDLQKSLVEAWGNLNLQQVAALNQERLRELLRIFPEFGVDVLLRKSDVATPMAPRRRQRIEDSPSSQARITPSP